MASETVSDKLLDPVRKHLALVAAGEIEVLLNLLAREKENESDGFDVILSTMLRRMKDVNSVVLSIVDEDDSRETGEMMEVVHG